MRNEILDTSEFSDLRFDDGFRFGARLTINTHRFLGHEFGYSYSRTKVVDEFFQGDELFSDRISVPTHQGYYAFLVYALPEGTVVRPFAAGGGHFSTYVPPGASVTYGQGVTKYGFNYGGGVKFIVSPLFGIRLDLREYRNPKPFTNNGDGWLRMIEASAGLSLVF